MGCGNQRKDGRPAGGPYRICENTWLTSSYHNCVNMQNIRLLCDREALEVGVEPLKTYTGLYGEKSVVAEWCEMMEVKS